MNTKYELLENDTIKTPCGKTLKRIRALIAIGSLVASGDVGGYVESIDNLSVYDNAWVSGNARVYGDADIFWISNIGSENGTYTAFNSKDGLILVNHGCFYGTLKYFEEAVNKTHGDNEYGKQYKLIIELTKLMLGSNNV